MTCFRLIMAFPAVQLSKRPLHFIYLCDCSGSMAAHGKIQALNHAIRQSLPGMAAVARDNPEAELLVRAISFADHANWHLATPTAIENLQWQDLQAHGLTAMGQALELLSESLKTPPMEIRALPPVLVLISDGQPTDDFESSLARLMTNPWAQKAVRLSIAIGHEADLDVLQQFIGSPLATTTEESMLLRPLQASNASSLAHYIEWAATTVVGATSQPISMLEGRNCWGNVGIVEIPPTIFAEDDVIAETVIW